MIIVEQRFEVVEVVEVVEVHEVAFVRVSHLLVGCRHQDLQSLDP